MKKYIVILSVFAILLSMILTACGSNPTQAADSDTSTQSATTTIDAKGLVDSKCTACHSLDRLSGENRDQAGWTKVVKQMDKKGNIGFTAAETDAIAAYLTETYK